MVATEDAVKTELLTRGIVACFPSVDQSLIPAPELRTRVKSPALTISATIAVT